MPNRNEYFDTDQLSLAGYLAVELGVDPEMEFDEGSMCSFMFPKSNRCVELVTLFTMGDALVEPREYWLKCSNIKGKMFREKDALAART